MTAPSTRRLIAGFLAVASVGCKTDGSTSPADILAVDLGSLITENSVNTINNIPGAFALLGLPVVVVPPVVTASACVYSASTMTFACPPLVRHGITFNISYSLMDVSGNREPQFVVGTTDAVHTVSSIAGIGTALLTNGVTDSISLTDHSDLTTAGLTAPNQSLNGLSTAHYDVTTLGATSVHSVIDLTTTTSNVIFPPAGSFVGWALSGSITTDATTVTEPGSALSLTTTAHLVITFNGTSSPSAVLTVGGSTFNCVLDLSATFAPSCS